MTASCRNRRLILASLSLFVLALATTLFCVFAHGRQREQIAIRQRILRSLDADLDRLARYEAVAAGLRSVGLAPTDRLPEGITPPARHQRKRLPQIGDWHGVQLELAWPRIPTAQFFALLNAATGATAPWRVARLDLQALEDARFVQLKLTLESAEPAIR